MLPHHEKSLLPACALASWQPVVWGFFLPLMFCPAEKHEIQLSFTAARGQVPSTSSVQAKGLTWSVTLFPQLEMTLNWGCIS